MLGWASALGEWGFLLYARCITFLYPTSHADGWGYSQLARGGVAPPPSADFGGGGGPSAGVLARQVIEFLHAVTYLRVPLIPLNAAVVLVKLVFG